MDTWVERFMTQVETVFVSELVGGGWIALFWRMAKAKVVKRFSFDVAAVNPEFPRTKNFL